MTVALNSFAEREAEKAEQLQAFSGLKLLHIKRQLAELLTLIGRQGMFEEYTRHDIAHVNEMLELIGWLIPESTKPRLTATDWLLIVLSVYFHDLGMFVSRSEYESRADTVFQQFVATHLFGGSSGIDYRDKVGTLESYRADRFLYQEFVRYNHAARIRQWLIGRPNAALGEAAEATQFLSELLSTLDEPFRRDLAFVCESHHLDDLHDLQRYKISQPYGSTREESASLFYAALILRTADLLHITRDRAPTVLFKLVNPTDPISLDEWAKQRAVRAVRPKLGRDREGNPDVDAPRDTIEVHAYFSQPDGFFGLTSYLGYARRQLTQSFEWAQAAQKKGSTFEFPWKYLDDANIETAGFLPKSFEFTLDQVKILDLLTGHTLYNDTGVVLRELAQNAIDAVRLQRFIDMRGDTSAVQTGGVLIRWAPQARTLEVEDHGTGMNQQIIERHFLRVGSSRYQDDQFKQDFSEFAPISRFGIGVLSAFMISDNVDIFTTSVDEPEARHLSLRSVHGKYLVRLLDKQTDLDVKRLGLHGTLIRLTIRASADVGDMLKTARRWIVVPGCDVLFQEGSSEPVKVGYATPKEALESVLLDTRSVNLGVRVEERTIGGVNIAYAVRWSNHFREWSFYSRGDDDDDGNLTGTCIGGIRVESLTPGFHARGIVCLANASGRGAPKTNVARSGLEFTPELEGMFRAVYDAYASHVCDEIAALTAERGFSLTWAGLEASFIASPLLVALEQLGGSGAPKSPRLLREAVWRIPAVLVERAGRRQMVSLAECDELDALWTIESELLRSVEDLLRETAGDGSLSRVAGSLGVADRLPEGTVLCQSRVYSSWSDLALDNREVDRVQLQERERRVDLRWSNRHASPRWRSLDTEFPRLRGTSVLRDYDYLSPERERIFEARVVRVAARDVDVEQQSNYRGLRTGRWALVFPGSDLCAWLLQVLDALSTLPERERFIYVVRVLSLFGRTRGEFSVAVVRRLLEDAEGGWPKAIDVGIAADFAKEFRRTVFDPRAWSRGTKTDNQFEIDY